MPFIQDTQQGNVGTYQYKYIRSVFFVGSHITNYNYNKIVIIK